VPSSVGLVWEEWAESESALAAANGLSAMGASLAQLQGLFGQSVLQQLRLVPRISDVNAADGAAAAAAAAACESPPQSPRVDWACATALAEQKEEERFPSQEQAALVDEVGELAARLTAFYFEHNTAMLKTVGEVSRQFVGREAELNDALRRKYKSDLKTMAAQQQAAEAAQRERDADAAHRLLEDLKSMAADQAAAGAAEGEEAAAAGAQERVAEAEGGGGALVSEGEMDEEVAQALAAIEGMGFTDRAQNLRLLETHGNNVEAALNALLG